MFYITILASFLVIPPLELRVLNSELGNKYVREKSQNCVTKTRDTV